MSRRQSKLLCGSLLLYVVVHLGDLGGSGGAAVLCEPAPLRGNPGRWRLSCRATEAKAPSTRKRRTREEAARDNLDKELVDLADALLPQASDLQLKKELLQKIEVATWTAGAAAGGVGALSNLAHAEIVPFGSSLNGCGEGQSDVDAAIWLPLREDEEEEGWEDPKPLETLIRVAAEVEKVGLRVLERRLGANVPIVVVELLKAQEDEDGGLLSRGTGYTCDLSAGQRLLPLYNTGLLRAYAELAKRLPALTIAVKRWAKLHGLAKTWERCISSYSWTLMVVYYLQVCHGLPSLHALAQRSKAPPGSRRGPSTKENAYDIEFLGSAEATKLLQEAGADPSQAAYNTRSAAELFVDFFRFYSKDFSWEQEVVSVRLGRRAMLADPDFSPWLRTSVHFKFGQSQVMEAPVFLNIEDPIELRRNLNFALTPDNSLRIQERLAEALQQLEVGGGLEEIIGQLPPPPQSQRPVSQWLDGFLPVREMNRPDPCLCFRCGRRFRAYIDMIEHQAQPRECQPKPLAFRCPRCFRGYRNAKDLEGHMTRSVRCVDLTGGGEEGDEADDVLFPPKEPKQSQEEEHVAALPRPPSGASGSRARGTRSSLLSARKSTRRRPPAKPPPLEFDPVTDLLSDI